MQVIRGGATAVVRWPIDHVRAVAAAAAITPLIAATGGHTSEFQDGTTCWVHLERHERTVELVVDDDGPGIPSSHTKAVFAPFRHGPAAEESASPGVGLGLALVAEYARLHGGRAWYEDSPGGGASIHVLLERRMDNITNPDR